MFRKILTNLKRYEIELWSSFQECSCLSQTCTCVLWWNSFSYYWSSSKSRKYIRENIHTQTKEDRLKGILFYLVFVSGSLVEVFGFAHVIKLLLDKLPTITFWFFITLSICSSRKCWSINILNLHILPSSNCLLLIKIMR